jgi:hypothetical protein
MTAPNENESVVPVKRGRVDSLTVYEVTDHELDELSRGGPTSLLLNFGLFLLSAGISFLIALVTTTIDSTRAFCVFVIVVVVSFIGGIILLLLWNANRQSLKKLLKRIKERMPKEDAIDRDAQQTDAVDKK